MKGPLVAIVAVLVCVGVGTALGNPSGGFVVGAVLAVMLAKRYGAKSATGSA